MRDKILKRKTYAQNLYAAMCNMQWQRAEMWPILKGDQIWSVSWRTSGGIVADVRKNNEDYMTWYCSGMRGIDYDTNYAEDGFVSEGTVTEEIAADMLELGWIPLPFKEE
jgi:hypothetical protein